MFFYDHDQSAWGWVGMTIGMVLFWGLVIAGVAWLVRGFSRTDEPWAPPQRLTPEQLLAERFARGEIDEAEYHDRLSTLSGQRPAVRP